MALILPFSGHICCEMVRVLWRQALRLKCHFITLFMNKNNQYLLSDYFVAGTMLNKIEGALPYEAYDLVSNIYIKHTT